MAQKILLHSFFSISSTAVRQLFTPDIATLYASG